MLLSLRCDYVLLFNLILFVVFVGWNLLEFIGFQLDFSCQNYSNIHTYTVHVDGRVIMCYNQKVAHYLISCLRT